MTAKNDAVLRDCFCTNVQAEVVRLLGGSEAFMEFIRRHPSYAADLWTFSMTEFNGQLTSAQAAAIWFSRRVQPRVAADRLDLPPQEAYRRQGRCDLAHVRETALLLRNQLPLGDEEGEDPYIEERPRGRGDDDGYDCFVQVADGCTMCIVPPFEGETGRDVAQAIAESGHLLLTLLSEIDQLRAANQALLAWRNGQTTTEVG